jgi:hypothetical protein
MKLFPEYYETNALQQVAILLWEGWGYNMFRKENQLRADSLLIRQKGSSILGRASTSMREAETAYRKVNLPLPTREKPLPDPEAVENARTIEAFVREVGRIESQLRAAPVPENDRLWQRHRRERNLLEQLLASDQSTIGKAEVFRRVVQGKDGQWILDNQVEIREALASLAESISERAELLTV